MSRELRMYGLVPYNISPIQQAIQYGHAVVEYGLEHFDNELYQDWARNWKTFIILNGGTSNDRMIEDSFVGTLNNHLRTLTQLGVKVGTFWEPDLGDMLTSIVFIVDERVFNFKTYPDYEKMVKDYTVNSGGDHIPSIDEWRSWFSDDSAEVDRILELRNFLRNFRLA